MSAIIFPYRAAFVETLILANYVESIIISIIRSTNEFSDVDSRILTDFQGCCNDSMLAWKIVYLSIITRNLLINHRILITHYIG